MSFWCVSEVVNQSSTQVPTFPPEGKSITRDTLRAHLQLCQRLLTTQHCPAGPKAPKKLHSHLLDTGLLHMISTNKTILLL